MLLRTKGWPGGEQDQRMNRRKVKVQEGTDAKSSPGGARRKSQSPKPWPTQKSSRGEK